MAAHGTNTRGLASAPANQIATSRFVRIFQQHGPALPDTPAVRNALQLLAKQVVQPANDATAPGLADEDENTEIPAGYTYFGQFIDHDLDFDPVSSLLKANDPQALEDFRTPRLDLDNIYGRGPSDQPFLFANDGLHFVMGNTDDFTRYQTGVPTATGLRRALGGRAIIGDPRNDENALISQLQALFLMFHNRVADLVVLDGVQEDDRFNEAAQRVRFHYQWIVMNDFLPRIVGGALENGLGEAIVRDILPRDPDSGLYKPANFRCVPTTGEARIPVEFAAAAYRFGHSMVRPSYFLNDEFDNVQTPAQIATEFNQKGRLPIFPGLAGFQSRKPEFWIDWKYFFPMPGEKTVTKGNHKNLVLPQPSYRIDDELGAPLGILPPSVAVNPSSLAERNLLRGLVLGLPSGQDVARQLQFEPVLTDAELKLDGAGFDLLKGRAPLWYYILRESKLKSGVERDPLGGLCLGPVGGRIVAETLLAMLYLDPNSFLNIAPGWSPDPRLGAHQVGERLVFGMPELVQAVMAAQPA